MSKKNIIPSEKNPSLEVTSNIYPNSSRETNHRDTPTLFHLKKFINSKLYHKYSTGHFSWTRICTDFLIYNEKCQIVARFKDFLIFDDDNEYIKRFYPIVDSKPRLEKIFKFYECYSKIFPNYLVIEENKYLYKNIRRKQKMIDAINAIKNEERENRKNINCHTNKNKNIFFSKPINEEIRKYIENASFKKKENNSFDSDDKNNSNTILINYSINQSEQSILLNSFLNNETNNSICDIMNFLSDSKVYTKNISPKKTTKTKKTFDRNKNRKNNAIKNKDTVCVSNNKTTSKKNAKINKIEGDFISPNKKTQDKKTTKNNLLGSSGKTKPTLSITKPQANPLIKLNPTSVSKRDLFESYKENLKTDKNINSNDTKKKMKKNYYKTQSNLKKILTEAKKKKTNFISQDLTNYTKKTENFVKSLSNHKKVKSNLLSHEVFKTEEGEDTDTKFKGGKHLLTEQKTYKKINNQKENNNILNTQTNVVKKSAVASNALLKQKTEYKIRKMQVKKLDFKETKTAFKKINKDHIKRTLLCKSTFNFYNTKKNITTLDTNNNSSKAISNFNKTVSKRELSNNNQKIINQKRKLITGKTHTKLYPKLIVSPTKKNTQTNTTYSNSKVDLNSKRMEYKSYLAKKNKKRSCDMDEEYKKNISQKIIDKMSKSKNMSINSKFFEKKNMDINNNTIEEAMQQHIRTLTEHNKINPNKNCVSHKTLDLHEPKPKKTITKKKTLRKNSAISEKKKEEGKIEKLKKDARNKINDKEKTSKKKE